MTMKVGASMSDFLISGDNFDWLQEVAEECNKLTASEVYPEKVCKQSRSLYVSGIIVSLFHRTNQTIGCHTYLGRSSFESVPCLLDLDVR